MKQRITNRILIIDIEPFLGENLAAKLSGAGFSVAHASNYQEALLLPIVFKVDMVILGYVSEDSLEICRQLHNVFNVPVILIGRDSGNEIWKKALLEAEAEFYVRSPFSTELLISRMKAILRRYLPQVPHEAGRIS